MTYALKKRIKAIYSSFLIVLLHYIPVISTSVWWIRNANRTALWEKLCRTVNMRKSLKASTSLLRSNIRWLSASNQWQLGVIIYAYWYSMGARLRGPIPDPDKQGSNPQMKSTAKADQSCVFWGAACKHGDINIYFLHFVF